MITKETKTVVYYSSTNWSYICTGTGKKAFIQADGIKTLYTLSLETLECKFALDWKERQAALFCKS